MIDLAGRRVLATSKGLHLRDAVFAIRLDRAGTVAEFRTFGDTAAEAVHEFAQWATGHVVVGLSTNQTFNVFHHSTTTSDPLASSTADTVSFAAAYGTDGFATAPLVTRQTTKLPPGI